MAIDIDHEFWNAVQAVAGLQTTLDYDRVLAQALRLILWSEQRFREGKIIRRSEYDARGFIPEFIGIHMEEVEPDCLMYIHADEKFDWIRQKQSAGRKGGLAQSDAQRRQRINTLRRSSTGANPEHDRSAAGALLPSSLSLESKDSLENIGTDEPQQELLPPEFQWLIELWNQLRGPMPALQKISKGTARYRHVVARLKKNPDPNTWRTIFTRMEKSEFVSGRSGKWAGGCFDWVIESETNVEKVLNGNYNPELKEVKKIDWGLEAQIIWQAVVSSSRRESIREEMVLLMRKAGLSWSQLGSWPPNDFSVKKLAGLLKAAHEN